VIVLPKAPQAEDADALDAVLAPLLPAPPVQVRPSANHCVKRAGDRLYVIAYNKSDEQIGAYFQESRLAEAERALRDVQLTVHAPTDIAGAHELVTGQALKADGPDTACLLPATRYRVIEITLERP
jgi:hypothetical protein